MIVIAAINPIEQANRARDTRFKADGGQLISAVDRYFTARSEFPWVTSGATANVDASYGFVSATTGDIGICDVTTGCSADGTLLTTSELKTEFRNRDFIQNAANVDQQIMVGKDSGASASVYACFIPLAKSTREKACADGKVYTIATDGSGARTQVTAGDATCAADNAAWTGSPYYVCIPE